MYLARNIETEKKDIYLYIILIYFDVAICIYFFKQIRSRSEIVHLFKHLIFCLKKKVFEPGVSMKPELLQQSQLGSICWWRADYIIF